MSKSSAPPSAFDARAFLRHLTREPGVYRMIASDGAVLYVGKAASLRSRVSSYFRSTGLSSRIASMVAQIAAVEVTITRTEAEALLLENQLIKALRPRYNVLLRDDKSYPQIFISSGPWPRIGMHRGPRSEQGRYFGPYPSSLAVRETLSRMHRLFRLRACEESVFRNRSRPCLQYQINRCSAPCVGLISSADYAQSVRRAMLFLDGHSNELMDDLERAMEQAQGTACVVLQSFRAGINQGTRAFFPRVHGTENSQEVLSAFVCQYYLEHQPPRELLLSEPIDDTALLEAVLAESAGYRVQIKHAVRGERAGYLALTQRNAEAALAAELASSASQRVRVEALTQLLGLSAAPTRMECFDISHTGGEATVASCVVFDGDGPVRGQYRRYNINGITPGDDYAAMHQALERRFRRAIEDGVIPDILFIDGGKGQLTQANAVLADLGVSGLIVVGVAKGEARRAGDETLILPDGSSCKPGAASPALQLVQQIRDEAHRFAITGHRGKRQKARVTSSLQEIIARVEGINAALAKRIYAGLHGLVAATVPVTTKAGDT
ncbi:MAG: excinuclease ABC subunit C [Gammaproteobacteria bacterium HGW-Gammaproteobacteria-2]|nr:MAG: excinuclease ABC subunit C [Gammaproteobacteria bacterium HGW-Gammaproteobacteria-2]